MQPMLMLLRSWRPFELLPVLILSLTCLCATAHAHAQNDHPVTLVGNGITLRTIFKVIKRQTGFAVMYSTQATALNQDEKVNVNFKNTPLDDVLAYVLRGKELDWKYNDDVLIIRKKAPVPAEKKIEVDSTVTPAMITGKVTDGSGAALPGATVQVKGTNKGTTTDENGNFSLPKVANGETLLISMVGYETQTMQVRGRRIIAQMTAVVSKLDETVVIAYGTTTQRLSVGNVATIKAKDIDKQPINNPLLALQGRIPGVFVNQNTGIAGGGITVRIQGQNSLLNGSDPLYVVDGVPILSQLPGALGAIIGNSGGLSGGGIVGTGNPLSYINPSDIESINVLKDADATAIYGSRAANGAILIVTKRGAIGPTRLNVNLQQGIEQVTRKVPMLNTAQYLEMRREALQNDGMAPNPNADYDLTLWDTTRYTDWQKVLLGNNAQYTNINVNLSGGTPILQYLLGGTYNRQTAVFPNHFADRKGAFHISLNNISPNQKLRIQFNSNYMVDNNQLPAEDLTRAAVLLEPDAPPLYKDDGTLNWAPNAAARSTWTNPLASLENSYKNTTTNLISNLNISYKILSALELRVNAGYTVLQSDELQTTTLASIKPERRATTTRRALYGNRNFDNWIIEPQASYVHRLLKKGTLDLLLGATIQQNSAKGQFIMGLGYNDDIAMKDQSSAATLLPNGSQMSNYKYCALFGRINYNWNNQYLFNFTVRRDGSSRFGLANRFHNFASSGVAWIFSEEKWAKTSLSFLSFGKLRISYGTTGNDQIPDYSFLNLYAPVNVGVPYQGILGIITLNLFNPYLQWEETRKLQAGLDLGFASDRILLNITYQRNRSSNQLLNYTLPSTTGFKTITSNFPAIIQNTSWEFAIKADILKDSRLIWTVNGNLTIPHNKLIDFPGLSSTSYANTYIIGEPVTINRLYHSLGVDPATGKYQYANSHGEPTSSPDYYDDRIITKNTTPKWYGGFQNSFIYKGFQLDILIQFVKQTGINNITNNGSSFYPGAFFSGWSNQPITVLNHWQKPGDKKKVAAYTTNPDETYYNLANADYTYHDASYLRLKNVSLSWQCPSNWCQVVHLQNARIYTQAQNLLTVTSYKGADPESQNLKVLPPLRVITAGIQIGL